MDEKNNYINDRLRDAERKSEDQGRELAVLATEFKYVKEGINKLDASIREYIQSNPVSASELEGEISKYIELVFPNFLDREFDRRTKKGKNWAWWIVGIYHVIITGYVLFHLITKGG